MTRVALLSCVSMKLTVPAPARELYVSPLFRMALRYAVDQRSERIFVLSAKYGLVDIDAWIDPYDQTLVSMTAGERERWAEGVLEQMRHAVDVANDDFVILAGAKYREHLVGHLAHFTVPMAGLGIGRQLQFLSRRPAVQVESETPDEESVGAPTV